LPLVLRRQRHLLVEEGIVLEQCGLEVPHVVLIICFGFRVLASVLEYL